MDKEIELEDLTLEVTEGTPLAEKLEPLDNPNVRAEVSRQLAAAGLRVTVLQIPAKGRHRRETT